MDTKARHHIRPLAGKRIGQPGIALDAESPQPGKPAVEHVAVKPQQIMIDPQNDLTRRR
jgi:hypothetical protein